MVLLTNKIMSGQRGWREILALWCSSIFVQFTLKKNGHSPAIYTIMSIRIRLNFQHTKLTAISLVRGCWWPGTPVKIVHRESELRHTLKASSLVPSAASNAYRPCKKPAPRTDNSCIPLWIPRRVWSAFTHEPQRKFQIPATFVICTTA